MAKYELKISDIIDETHDVKTFRFGLNGIEINFRPGQFVMANRMIDGKLVRRAYSISSSPFEKGHIDLTIKRVENGIFSNYMLDFAKVGDVFSIDGPYGKFFYEDSNRDVVLIGCGCGITPLVCIARYMLEKKLDANILFVYSAKTPDDMLFMKELKRLEEENKNLKYVITITRPTGYEWKGLTGRINKDMLISNVKNFDNSLFFVSGLRSFGHDVLEMLWELGAKEEHVKDEVY